MLKDVIDGVNLEGENHTRQKFLNTIKEFTERNKFPTKRVYQFQHHNVFELHGARFLACVKHGESALLVESDAKGNKLVVLSDMDTSIYSQALAEGNDAIRQHVAAMKPKRVRKPAVKKPAVKKENSANGS